MEKKQTHSEKERFKLRRKGGQEERRAKLCWICELEEAREGFSLFLRRSEPGWLRSHHVKEISHVLLSSILT
jgi:hypothetical protein